MYILTLALQDLAFSEYLLKYEMTVDLLKSKSTCLYEYKFEVL